MESMAKVVQKMKLLLLYCEKKRNKNARHTYKLDTYLYKEAYLYAAYESKYYMCTKYQVSVWEGMIFMFGKCKKVHNAEL